MKHSVNNLVAALDGCHQAVIKAVHLLLFSGHVSIDSRFCKGCGLCTSACPAHALSLTGALNAVGNPTCTQVRPDKCIGCACCALVCPDGCITVLNAGPVSRPALQSDIQWKGTQK
ncbi:MAG: 4Fe-4S binding protein [Bacteroidales bacterium]|nr:4Fe-4S binding protein [Bacteroidales bacterium]